MVEPALVRQPPRWSRHGTARHGTVKRETETERESTEERQLGTSGLSERYRHNAAITQHSSWVNPGVAVRRYRGTAVVVRTAPGARRRV